MENTFEIEPTKEFVVVKCESAGSKYNSLILSVGIAKFNINEYMKNPFNFREYYDNPSNYLYFTLNRAEQEAIGKVSDEGIQEYWKKRLEKADIKEKLELMTLFKGKVPLKIFMMMLKSFMKSVDENHIIFERGLGIWTNMINHIFTANNEKEVFPFYKVVDIRSFLFANRQFLDPKLMWKGTSPTFDFKNTYITGKDSFEMYKEGAVRNAISEGLMILNLMRLNPNINF